MTNQTLDKILNIKYPIIMAPMFLISNVEMVVEACNNGISGCFPALNYRTIDELAKAIDEINSKTKNSFGVNLIVNKSNVLFPKQLEVLIEKKVSYIITSLGNPKPVIDACKGTGIKVFCDVTNLEYALKVQNLGADALIAVASEAGGHCGYISKDELIPLLIENTNLPVIAAGGVSHKKNVDDYMSKGVAGVSVGTIFIASEEAPVSEEYKQALVDYSAKDIVLTTKISGSHLTIINTPFVQQNGLKATWLEKLLKFKPLKKYIKMIIAYKGMLSLKKAATTATYKTYFVAGPSIEGVFKVEKISQIIKQLTSE